MTSTTRFFIRSFALLLSLSFPLAARADFAADIREPIRLFQAKDFAKAATALDKIAPQYQEQFLVHYLQGAVKMARLNDKAPAAESIAALQSARASLLKAQALADDEEKKKEALDLQKVAEDALRELKAPLEAAPEPDVQSKDEEIAELRRRLAELEGKGTGTPAQPAAPTTTTSASTLPMGPPDLPGTLPKLSPLKPTPQTAKGRVLNRSGKPIAGVEVKVSGTTLAGERTAFYPKTNAQGIYSTPVPDGIYTTRAEVKTNYNGQTFTFALHPLDGDHDTPQDSRKGVVEDYVWRLSGLKGDDVENEDKPWNYYGGEVKVGLADIGNYGVINDTQGPREKAEFPQGFRVELTFTPEGTLPDGLPGRAFSFSKEFKPADGPWPYMNPSFRFVDVPAGRYTVCARLVKPDGSARDLQLTTRIYRPLQTPALSQVMDFEPDGSSLRPVNINLYAWPAEKAG